MRIAYFAYTNLNNPGAPRIHVRAIAEGLADKGHEITLIVPAGFGRIDHENIRMVEISSRPHHTIFWSKKVRSWLAKNRDSFDIVYLRDFYNSTPIAKASKAAGLPIVMEINGSLRREISVPEEKFKYRLMGNIDLNFYLKRRFKIVDRIIAVSPGLIAEYAPFAGGEDKFSFMPNGVDIELFAPVAEKQNLREDLDLGRFKPILGSVGSILAYHVDSPIIRAVERLAERYSSLGFVFVGGGPGKEELKKIADQSPARDRIVFRGPVSIEESAKYIASLDIAVAWSTDETAQGTWPVRLSAYSSGGIPIVGPDWGTYLTFEEVGALKTAKDGSYTNIADAVAEIIETPEIAEKMSRAGRKYAVENLSWESIVNNTEKILFDLVNN